MKNWITNLTVAITCFTASAYADPGSLNQAPFVSVTTDAAPGEVYHLGYLLNEKSEIAGVYYANPYAPDPQDQVKSFSMAEIQKGAVLVSKENDGKIYELVRGKGALQADNTFKFTLDYLKNAVFGSRGSVQLGVRFNAVSNKFEAFHLSTLKTITGAKIIVKYLGGQAIGVDQVVFQYAKKKRVQRLQ